MPDILGQYLGIPTLVIDQERKFKETYTLMESILFIGGSYIPQSDCELTKLLSIEP